MCPVICYILMKVSVVIPNYNGKELLAKNIPHVLTSHHVDEVIVVDDASTDESGAYLKKQFPEVILIEKATNHGFSTSVNLGVKAARGELVVLLNTDATPQKDFLEPVLPHFSNPRIFAVGCLDQSIEGNQTIERGRGIAKFARGFLMHGRGETNRTNTLWVTGGSGVFRKKLWEELKGLDPLYDPFYWEDIDLSYRAQKMGYHVVFESKSVVTHRHTEGAIKAHYSKDKICTIAYRNQFIFVWKNIRDTGLLLEHFLWLPYHFISALFRMDWPFFAGFGEALWRLSVILTQTPKKKPLVSDREIIQSFA